MSQVASTPNLERESLIARLESSQERLLKMVADVNEQRSSIRTAEDRWSIRDIVEHLVLCEYRFVDRVKKAEASAASPDFEKDAALHARASDRLQKRQASEPVLPSGQFPTLSKATAAFKEARRQTIEFVRSGPQDLRRMKAQGALGEMDGYQILLFDALHTERHALQIDEIKNDPAYRK
jgi:uncharacterized damage-inducible protein DinB